MGAGEIETIPGQAGSSPARTRSRFNTKSDKALLAEVLSTPPYETERGAVKGVWASITERVNQSLQTNFSTRACRDRTGLLLRQYEAQKKANESASGTSEVHTSMDDVLERILLLRDAASGQKQAKRAHQNTKTQELETAGQRLMRAAEERVSERIEGGDDAREGQQREKPKRRRLSVMLEHEQKEAVERRKLEEKKVALQKEERNLRREELDEQRRQRNLMQEQMQQQAEQTSALMKLLAAAISEKHM
ncbi:hypothetical protein PR001_g30004 [Phytophthora rubi]|uniref:Myb-like domain-containing protein n=1 Tax=Phytophthora rubi TaxID=129364 RepID=A0A6A3GXC1_9STRA|nr:hypothetical protein PR001_g30004 [Phytophthora rubi]